MTISQINRRKTDRPDSDPAPVAAQFDAARLHVDDRRAPPIGHVGSFRSYHALRAQHLDLGPAVTQFGQDVPGVLPHAGGGAATAGARRPAMAPILTRSTGRPTPGASSNRARKSRPAICGSASAWTPTDRAGRATPIAQSSSAQSAAGRVVSTVSSSARRRRRLAFANPRGWRRRGPQQVVQRPRWRASAAHCSSLLAGDVDRPVGALERARGGRGGGSRCPEGRIDAADQVDWRRPSPWSPAHDSSIDTVLSMRVPRGVRQRRAIAMAAV